MKVFISWSGELSHKVAVALRDWLPNVVQYICPYVSSEDIDKGAKWFIDVSEELDKSNFGILCVTSENQESPWLLFEAGALSKKLDRSRVSPFLVNIEPFDLSGPLTQFQATLFLKDDLKKLVNSINKNSEDHSLPQERLDNAFDKWWPDLNQTLKIAKENYSKGRAEEPPRPERELLEEVISNTRAILSIISQKTEQHKESSLEKTLKKTILDELSNVSLPSLTALLTAQQLSMPSKEPSTDPSKVKTLSYKKNVTREQRKVLSHLYFEQAQSLEELARNTKCSKDKVLEIVNGLSPLIQDKEGNGLLWARVFNQKWARELALEASKERSDEFK